MSFGIVLNNGLADMTFASGNDLLTNVVLSLEIRQGDFFADPSFGLRRRQRLKNTPATARLLQGDIEQALKWLLDIKRAAKIEVVMSLDISEDKNRLKAFITVTGINGQVVTYEKFVEVV